MKAQIITIGNELLTGQTVNTNAAFIGEKLTDLHFDVIRSSSVKDDESEILAEFESSLANYDLVIVTGGLGPTHDDVTRKCIVKYFDTELELNDGVLSDVQALFEKKGMDVTNVNKDQAFVPKGATVMRNSLGTAPGLWMEKGKKVLISLPGVPYEMKGILESSAIPMLTDHFDLENYRKTSLTLLTTGIPESILYERLGNLNDLLEGTQLAFLPNQYGVKLKLTEEGTNVEEVKDKLSSIEQRIRSLVGRYIYGKDTDTLEEVVSKLLIDRGLTISVAESCTGGLISHRLTNVGGSSAYFERAFITYSNGAKVEHLHIDEDLVQKYGAVSLEVARLMADGVRSVSGTDIGLAATGIMGPSGGTASKPVGLVYIGVCDENICTAREFRFGDDRLLNKDRTSQAALEMLRRNLLGIPYDE